MNNLIKNKNILKILIVTILVLISCFVSMYIQNKEKSITINDKEFNNEKGKISVYLSGAINSPGVYSFKEGINLEEALNIIGGITDEADISKINLSKTLYNSEKIVIPVKQTEIITEDIDEVEEYNIISDSNKININKANESELKSLPGIGVATAKNIVEYRNKTNFDVIEDIKKVKGIGDAKFETIKDMITVE